MSTTPRIARARLAALVRHHGQDDPSVADARQELARANSEQQRLRTHIARMTPELRGRVLDVLDLEDEGASAA